MDLVAKYGEGNLVDISEFYWELDKVITEGRLKQVYDSLDKDGLYFPILIAPEQSFQEWLRQNPYRDRWRKAKAVEQGWRCSLGNTRVSWAVKNGYTRIDTIRTKHWLDWTKFKQ